MKKNIHGIVGQALPAIGHPYTRDLTDKVFQEIQKNANLHSRYRLLVSRFGPRTVNSFIAQSITQQTGLRNLGTRINSPVSILIQSCAELG